MSDTMAKIELTVPYKLNLSSSNYGFGEGRTPGRLSEFAESISVLISNFFHAFFRVETRMER
jgi:hypothetical protein